MTTARRERAFVVALVVLFGTSLFSATRAFDSMRAVDVLRVSACGFFLGALVVGVARMIGRKNRVTS